MAVFIRNPRVREGDFFDRPFETLDSDAVVDLEEVAKNERQASEEVGGEFFRREREHQASDSRSREKCVDVDAGQGEHEDDSEAPYEDGRRVLEKRKELFRERARFENLGERLVEDGKREHVGEPEAGDGGDDRKGFVGDAPIFRSRRYGVYERIPADRANESLDSEGGSKGGRRCEKSHMEEEK